MYEPDKWVIVKIRDGKTILYRVLAGWYGGYLSGDSWKMNSGITSYIETDKYYDFVGSSGSVYRCYKANEGLSGYMSSILAGYQTQVGANVIKQISIKTFKRLYAKSQALR